MKKSNLSFFFFVTILLNCRRSKSEESPGEASGVPSILSYNFNYPDSGAYKYDFSTSDGIQRSEEATLVNPNGENPFLVVKGSYSYIGPDGVTYTVTYTADENGFHPQGTHINVPPWNGQNAVESRQPEIKRSPETQLKEEDFSLNDLEKFDSENLKSAISEVKKSTYNPHGFGDDMAVAESNSFLTSSVKGSILGLLGFNPEEDTDGVFSIEDVNFLL